MRSQEAKVSPASDYYVYAPSALAARLYLYPTSVGYFYYEAGYRIRRNRFDSFLIMYISKGTCSISIPEKSFMARTGQFVLLDCYQPHSYGSPKPWDALWLHFDGRLARDYFEEIISSYGYVLDTEDTQAPLSQLQKIYDVFHTSTTILEGKLSGYITKLLNNFLYSSEDSRKKRADGPTMAEAISYINEHFQSDLPLEKLAAEANMSPFHFSRVFTKETGITPHQYLIKTRLSAAKYLLKSTETSIKNIAFSIGFNSESSFCTTFKKWENVTPSQYRQEILNESGSDS